MTDKQKVKDAEEVMRDRSDLFFTCVLTTKQATRFMDGEDKLISLQPTTKKTRVSETNFDLSNIATKRFAGVESRVTEPKKGTLCPESRLPLKAKHLIHVKFHRLPNAQQPMDSSSGNFGCPVCGQSAFFLFFFSFS